MTKTELFRSLHHGARPLVLPNAWDYGSAALLAEAGFAAVGTTSLGVAAAAGLPDGTAATRDETLTLARRLGRLPIPVTVDVEGGFSTDPGEVARFCAELAAAGIAGINLEDSRANAGLADPVAHGEVIAAVKSTAPELFVNARTDTHWLGLEVDSTLARVQHYEKCGADGVFVPGLTDADGIRALTAATTVPLNVLFSPAGPAVAELAELGVRRISTGSLLYRAALAAAVHTAESVAHDHQLVGEIPSYATIQRLLET
ncbi:isocitrate lyase/phosphoenolpyruvate mutase family protein [Nocardia yunnanensis]|uniref:Isocitrate lyase/phosphoenolpyruvate mutase family protein n=1 Tax=Nocardia yunnanensis TaxID=2382165 RepID=A0A386ZHV1_9NOCA|nr:isocitrate lyase/phosphoenolpyruvate mutase family protein [Nocardia yunnanensis]AYF76155.1 isocitrate lyase/phosphoenolpyruvate mutase family protein [Nocardia yunnanensis]